jgi:hypothetical protein
MVKKGAATAKARLEDLRQVKVHTFWRQYKKRDDIVERFKNDPDLHDEDMAESFRATEAVCLMMGYSAQSRLQKKVGRKHDYLSKRQTVECLPVPYLKTAKAEDYQETNLKPRCHQFHGKFCKLFVEGNTVGSVHVMRV